jgi:dipeptidyl aminopeptidase/acylaminoacyl peptidase
LQFSKDDDFLYLTAGDEAKIKVFILPVPPTPLESTTRPKLDSKHSTPVPLTQSKAASGLQILPGRILFSQSSFTTPNDVYVIKNPREIEQAIVADAGPLTIEAKIEKVTDFWTTDLGRKNLSEGEEFWFKGAEGKSVQGWSLKPKGWKDGDTKKWPTVLLIHGGCHNLQRMFFQRLNSILHCRTTGRLGGPMVNAMESKWLWPKSSSLNFAHCPFDS